MGTIPAAYRPAVAGGFLALLLCLSSTDLRALPPYGTDTTVSSPRLYRVSLKDGSELIGVILRQTADSLMFRTGANLTFTVSRLQVAELNELSGTFADGEYRRSDPNRSRLFFGPTARPVHGGYFADYEIFLPFLSFGIADIVTVSGGMTLFPGATEQLYYIAPKVSVPLGTENVSLAGGVLYTNITSGETGGAGIAYGVTTIGSSSAALTVGFGLGFAGGEFAKSPIVLLGGEARLSNSVALISENWIPTGSDVQLISFGFRFFGDHLSADLGFFYPLTNSSTTGFPFLPWLGFCYNFSGGS
jgi:hypothetical protein